jgi:predicted Holliday junction resolvase-like endonuclease
MAGIPIDTVILGALAVLLLIAIIMMAAIAAQLKALRREAEATRSQLAKMDWSQLLFNGVQQMKDAVKALETIDKRLQKLEAIEKVQLSHINVRAGR